MFPCAVQYTLVYLLVPLFLIKSITVILDLSCLCMFAIQGADNLSLQFIGFVCFLNLFIQFIYFWLRWVFIVVHGLSLVAMSGGYSSLWCTGFSLWWLLLVVEHRLQARRLQQLWLTGSRAQAQWLWHTGLVAPWHVGSSRTRA